MADLYKVYCKNCNTVIYKTSRRFNENIKLGNNFYCSESCESKEKNKKLTIICENILCKKNIFKKLSDISLYNYCSRSCAMKVNNQKRVIFKVCFQCGEKFKGGNKYCSIICAQNGRRGYTKKSLINEIQIASQTSHRVPSKREFIKLADRCRSIFGSWNNAVMAAGLQPHRSHSQRMYKRNITCATDGHVCDSISEALIDNWLVEYGIAHKRDMVYPTTNHKADWAVNNGMVFIEYFGLAHDSPRYDRAILLKRDLCKNNGIELIEIYPKDLYPYIHLDKKLERFIICL